MSNSDNTNIIQRKTLPSIVRSLESVLDIKVDYTLSKFNAKVSNVTTNKGVLSNLRWCQLLRKIITLGGGCLQSYDSLSRDLISDTYKVILKSSSVKEPTIEQPQIEINVIDTVEDELETIQEAFPEPAIIKSIEAIDLAYAESLYVEGEDKESKKALDLYATEFGYSLNGRKSFSNMIKELKACL